MGGAAAASDRFEVVESSEGRTISSSRRRESCEGLGEGLGGEALSTIVGGRGESTFVELERASRFRGGAGGALAGVGTSSELLDKELLLEFPSLLVLGASCNLNSSLGCVFALGPFPSSAPGEALGFPFLLESFRPGRSCWGG